ncbi:hypothetical protein BYT27DRAFT_7255360 [Phlegmacium glaucopus]|nr:hypothetical protein BYT27DRAFT_7255360 [Phlegmacium glaucopus]
MSQIGLPANGGKKIKPPPPPPNPDPLFSTLSSPHHATFVRQRMSALNDSSAPLSYRSGNDAVTAHESFHIAKRFFFNQPVSVNIEGRGWLLGTVVLLAKSVQSFTGSVVRVRYTIPTERNERESEFPNHPDYVRPR